MGNLVHQLVEFGRASTYEKLPAEVANEAKRLLLDSAACAVGALSIEKGKIAVDIAHAMQGPAEAKVIGAGLKLSASSAAFANAELINALDQDSLLTPPGHVVPYVIPAILATAETQRRSGKDLIAALAVGHEVSARLGKAMGYYRDAKPGQKLTFPLISGFSSTIFGGTLGTAMLRGLDAQRTAYAMGLAGHMTPMQTLGHWARIHPKSDDKYHSAGFSCQGELLAVLMAEKGYIGDVDVFEGETGFWRFAGASGWKPEAVTDGLGTQWTYPEVCIYKPWAHCRTTHTALDCLQHLLDTHDLKPDEIERIDVFWDSHCANLPEWSTEDIVSVSDAEMSTQYAVSMVVHRVQTGPEWYSKETLANRKYHDFFRKIRVYPHPKFEETLLANPHTRIGGVKILARGQVFEEERLFRKGSPATPETRMTDEEMAQKFHVNAKRIMPADRCDRIIDTVLSLEKLDDVTTLADLW